jgi:hypothetical protein
MTEIISSTEFARLRIIREAAPVLADSLKMSAMQGRRTRSPQEIQEAFELDGLHLEPTVSFFDLNMRGKENDAIMKIQRHVWAVFNATFPAHEVARIFVGYLRDEDTHAIHVLRVEAPSEMAYRIQALFGQIANQAERILS